MTYQRAHRSTETVRLQAALARASRAGDPNSDKLPELRRKLAVSTMADKVAQAIQRHAPDTMTRNDVRAVTDAFHKALDSLPIE